MNERLKKIRENLKLTQKEIAEKVGISLRAWQNYELGLRKVPTNLVKTLYEQLGVNPIWLLSGEGFMLIEGETNNSKETAESIKQWIDSFFKAATEEEKIWFKIQFSKCFPEYLEWAEEGKKESSDP